MVMGLMKSIFGEWTSKITRYIDVRQGTKVLTHIPEG